MEVFFYPVPTSTPAMPFGHPFVLRNWDRLEQLDPPVLGTRYAQKIKRTDLHPIHVVTEICGTLDQWQNGISWEIWQAGGYSCDCFPLLFGPPPVAVNRVYNLDGSLYALPETGDVEVHLIVSHPNAWTALQQFLQSSPAAAAIRVVANAAPTADIQEWTDSSLGALAGVGRLGELKSASALIGGGLSAILGTPLEVQNSGAVQFAVDNAGGIYLSSLTGSAPAGSAVNGFPVYDAAGAFIGYVPVFGGTPPPTTIEADDFDGTDGDPLNLRVPDLVDTLSTHWNDPANEWEILGNAASLTYGLLPIGWKFLLLNDPTSAADVSIQATVDWTGGAAILMLLRSVDANNTYAIGQYNGWGVGGEMRIYKIVAGVFTQLAAAACTTGVVTPINVSILGDHITATVLATSVDVHDSSFAAAGTAGLAVYGDVTHQGAIQDWIWTTP